jgi:hypothetical protein
VYTVYTIFPGCQKTVLVSSCVTEMIGQDNKPAPPIRKAVTIPSCDPET